MVVILCLILGANIGLAQGVYVTAIAGYGLGAGTQEIDFNATFTGTTSSYEGIYGSLGEGFKFGVSAGYMFDKNLGAELGLSYWLGKAFEASLIAAMPAGYKWSGSGFVAVPSIVVSANTKTISPYARFGLVLAILKVKRESRDAFSGQTIERTLEETGNLAFGYAGALGIVVPAGGAVDFFAEVALYSVTYSPSQEEITKYAVNGVDQKPSLVRTVYKYEDSYNNSTSDVGLAVRRPFSSIGIVVGARVNL
jgi:hypothetical protein